MNREYLGNSWLETGRIPDDLTSEDCFNRLWSLHPEEHGEVMIYGKMTPIPRWQRSYGRDYYFSGTVSKGYPIPDELVPY
ncbi:unnamed protein product, partial [marine sediment metagenome]